MAEHNPELQAKLNALDHELEEGDITRKGCARLVMLVRLSACHGRG